MLRLDRSAHTLGHDAGYRFRARERSWEKAEASLQGEAVTPQEAVHWLQCESGAPLRVPIGVIGPREARAEQVAVARSVGQGLARMGLTVLCGGRQGIMEAVCQGVAEEGGLSIGLLPEADAQYANPFVGVALATGIGEARNALIARASLCLIAIGDSYGTLSEVALGLQFGKTVLGLAGAASVAAVTHCSDAAAALESVADLVLGHPGRLPGL